MRRCEYGISHPPGGAPSCAEYSGIRGILSSPFLRERGWSKIPRQRGREGVHDGCARVVSAVSHRRYTGLKTRGTKRIQPIFPGFAGPFPAAGGNETPQSGDLAPLDARGARTVVREGTGQLRVRSRLVSLTAEFGIVDTCSER